MTTRTHSTPIITHVGWLLSLVVVSGLLASPSVALPSYTNGLVITSASVQVESVATPSTWISATTVYEGSTARITMEIEAPESGAVRTTVAMPGVSGLIGDSTKSVPPGPSTLTIPIDLSYGAWLAGLNQNSQNHVDVRVSFTPTPPAPVVPDTGPATVPAPLPAPLPTPLPSPSPQMTAMPNEPPVVTATVPPVRPVRLTVTGTLNSDRRSMRVAIRAFPPGASVIAILRSSKSPGSKCPTRSQLARFVTKAAESAGRTVTLRRGAPTPRGCAQVELRYVEEPQAIATALSTSTSFEVPLLLAPRPLILVHGMWSSASAWDTYTQAGNRLITEHPRWQGFAVSTMNTGSPLFPFESVNTVTKNANLAWTFIQEKMLALNAHEVDIAAHSLGGVITRRMLHDATYGSSARNAIRSVVLLGTPNGGSSCSDAFTVPANRELTYTAMTTFNEAYPGYPGAFTTSLYSDHYSATCFDSNSGDLFVPTWSTQAQSVNVVRKIDPGIQHANMTSDARLFTDYVLPALALPSAPAPAGPTTALTNPSGPSTRLDGGNAMGNPLAVTRTVTIPAGKTLVASVVAEGASGSLQYTRGGTPISVALTSVRDFPLFEARASYADLGGSGEAPLAIEVTISATSSAAAPEWRWSLTTES